MDKNPLTPDAPPPHDQADTPEQTIHPASIFGADVAPGSGTPPPPPAETTQRSIMAEPGSASAGSAALDRRGFTSVLFAIPDTDTVEFCRLPEEVRDNTRRLLSAFELIHCAPNKVTACKAQAVTFRGKRGFSWNSIYRKYYAYLNTLNWRSALDRAKAGPEYWSTAGDEARALPHGFLEHWRGLAGANQRKCKPAWRKLIKQWDLSRPGARKWAIPGYDAPPAPDPATGRPRGWEDTNLMRHRPSRLELIAQRQGRS